MIQYLGFNISDVMKVEVRNVSSGSMIKIPKMTAVINNNNNTGTKIATPIEFIVYLHVMYNDHFDVVFLCFSSNNHRVVLYLLAAFLNSGLAELCSKIAGASEAKAGSEGK